MSDTAIRVAGVQAPGVVAIPAGTPPAPPGGAGAMQLTTWMDWGTSTLMRVAPTGYDFVYLSMQGYGASVAAILENGSPPYFPAYHCSVAVTQVGLSDSGDDLWIKFYAFGANMPGWQSNPSIQAVVSAYTLDGASSLRMKTTNLTYDTVNANAVMSGWGDVAITGSMFSLSEPALQVASPCMMALNYSLTLTSGGD